MTPPTPLPTAPRNGPSEPRPNNAQEARPTDPTTLRPAADFLELDEISLAFWGAAALHRHDERR
ncbi:MAG: hypothetical protein HUU23_00885 [Caldilineales bacterium]|nr:hypothetical protein [Caldilineales bacterium]